MWIRLFLACFIVLCSFVATGQTYPGTREKFVKTFQKEMSTFVKGDSRKFVKSILPELLNGSSKVSRSSFNRMVETCNLLVEKRFKAYPDIFNYVYSACSFYMNRQSEESFDAWHESVDALAVNKTKKKFVNFIDFSCSFFTEHKIASSTGFSWYYEGGDYSFEFKKNAVINFLDGNLVCRVHSGSGRSYKVIDSIEIIETSGTYNPVLKKWNGAGGSITWERSGLYSAETFAELRSYDVSMKKSALRADSVFLTSMYFDAPVLGKLSERAFKVNRESDRLFPYFSSYQNTYVIEDVVPDVDYIGGFELKGAIFNGIGTSDAPAQIRVMTNGVPFLLAKSEKVYIGEENIRIDRAESTLYLRSGDSIYHPGVNLTYDFKTDAIAMTRSENGIGQAAFQDSYHQVDIYVPKLVWELGGDDLIFAHQFGKSQEQRIARIESKNFFDEQLYNRLQGLSSDHPLKQLGDYAYTYDERTLTVGRAASALGLSVEQATRQLIELSNLGFITYDSDRKQVTINDKLTTFVNAKAGTSDYDNIVFVSDFRPKSSKLLEGKTRKQIQADDYLSYLDSLFTSTNRLRARMNEYGRINLTTLGLNMEAIDAIRISDNKNVVIIPSGSKLELQKNRNFTFSGWVYAGKLQVESVAANFDYSAFKIKLLKTKETVFEVRPFSSEDGKRNIKMSSSIYGISGEILIDAPSNKSGIDQTFFAYPKLISSSTSKIYYNDRSIYRGVYDSSRFYYSLNPFELDTLNAFSERSLRLKGALTSAGIFPVIREDIKIMRDYSFGFSVKAPAGGYPFYETDAKYENKIILSNNGLQGAGTIDFINSTSESIGLLSFLPDSTIGIVNFENRPSEESISYPDVRSEEAYMSYVPRENLLKVSSLPERKLNFFGGDAKLRGTIAIQPEGMSGRGLMLFENASLVSDHFDYTRWEIYAKNSDFSLKGTGEGDNSLAFNTRNVSSDISFKDRKGVFHSNVGESEVIFPLNQFKCKMDKFTWFMDDFEIAMELQQDKNLSIDAGIDLVGPNFYSTNPKQDALEFRVPKATFDIKEKAIYCSDVQFLDIADARIYPDSMKLNIRKKAKIDVLKNARIVASYITKYHRFVDTEVEIIARRDYKAMGNYPYYDLDSNLQFIRMTDIGPDSSYQTRASGEISDSDGFKLSPQFDYYGKVNIRASNPLLLFDGATRINHSCSKFERSWMSFKAQIDPTNIQIPVQESMVDLDGKTISAGIVWRDSRATDSLNLYPTFLSSLVSSKDPIVMTSSGLLQYNQQKNEFQIGSKEKLINQQEQGNYIALNIESCSLLGEGKIDLGMDFGEVEVDAVGSVSYDQLTEETSMNLTAKFKMELDKGIMQNLANRINVLDLKSPTNFNTITLEQAILEWDGEKEANDFKSKFFIDGGIKKVPNGLYSTLTFSGIRLSSFAENQNHGLLNNVNSAILVSIYGKPVMKYVPFRAYFQQIYSGGGKDQFTLLMDLPIGNDYLFNYTMIKKDGLLRIATSDQEFSAEIDALNEDKRKSKNFKYETTSQSIFKMKLIDMFEEK